ncbi:MAG: hypothetical protein WKF34_05175 [Pyrinomonadaceae bacterium]
MTKKIDEIIASRNLECDLDNGRHLIIRIGKPTQFEDSEDYYVLYQITGVGDEKTKFVGGVDGVQCLQLVMKGIAADLWRINNTLGWKLRWNGEAGSLGFPD